MYNLYVKPDIGPIAIIHIDVQKVKNAGITSYPNGEYSRTQEIARQIKEAFSTLRPENSHPAIQAAEKFITAAPGLGQIPGIVVAISGIIEDPDFVKLKEQVKSLEKTISQQNQEISYYKQQLTNETVRQSDRNASEYTAKIAELNRQLTEVRAALQNSLLENQAVKKQAETAQIENGALQAKLRQQEFTIQNLENKIHELETQLAENKQNLKKTKDEYKALLEKYTSLEKDFQNAQQEIAELKATIAQHNFQQDDPQDPTILRRGLR